MRGRRTAAKHDRCISGSRLPRRAFLSSRGFAAPPDVVNRPQLCCDLEDSVFARSSRGEAADVDLRASWQHAPWNAVGVCWRDARRSTFATAQPARLGRAASAKSAQSAVKTSASIRCNHRCHAVTAHSSSFSSGQQLMMRVRGTPASRACASAMSVKSNWLTACASLSTANRQPDLMARRASE